MTREEFIKLSTDFHNKLEQLRQDYFTSCYLSVSEIHRLFPHGAKVQILPNKDNIHIRNGCPVKSTDVNKIVGKVGEIDLTWNKYSESWIDVKFIDDEGKPRWVLVNYWQLKVL